MQNNSILDFQVEMLDANLKMNLANNCITDIVQKLELDEVFETVDKKLNFEGNLINEYISAITKTVVDEIAQRGVENQNYSLIITMLDAKNLSDFFERIGTIASLAPDIVSKITTQIIELYMSQCNKYFIDMDDQLLMHSPIFAN